MKLALYSVWTHLANCPLGSSSASWRVKSCSLGLLGCCAFGKGKSDRNDLKRSKTVKEVALE